MGTSSPRISLRPFSKRPSGSISVSPAIAPWLTTVAATSHGRTFANTLDVTGPGEVRFGGVALTCDADGLRVGDEVTIAVRPEDIVVRGVEPGDRNSLELDVRAMEFLGSFFRADLGSEATGATSLRADFSINLVRRQDLSEGVRLMVSIPPERIRVYPGGAIHG